MWCTYSLPLHDLMRFTHSSEQERHYIFLFWIWGHQHPEESAVDKILQLRPWVGLEPVSWEAFSSILSTKSSGFSKEQVSKPCPSHSPLGNFNKLSVKQRIGCSQGGAAQLQLSKEASNTPNFHGHDFCFIMPVKTDRSYSGPLSP